MNTKIELTKFNNETLVAYSAKELISLMIKHEDRVPRNVIDECARRGEKMLEVLTPIAQANDELEDEIPGYWWLRLHAMMILGLIPGEAAGLLLVEFIRGLCRQDENLQEWLDGYWAALVRNKPPSIFALLRDICADKKVDWYMRSNITGAVITDAYQRGGAALEQTLDWAAQFIADEEDDWQYRLCTANDLLDYPRDRHRALITELTARQNGMGVHFDIKDISKAYAQGTDAPRLDRFNDPWCFYERTEIEKRQHRWQEEACIAQASDSDDLPGAGLDYHYQPSYQRETQKIGRNEPCPCGSGKKYKNCCLGRNE